MDALSFYFSLNINNIVASQICQDTIFYFYQCSYAGIQIGYPYPITELNLFIFTTSYDGMFLLLTWSVLNQFRVTWLQINYRFIILMNHNTRSCHKIINKYDDLFLIIYTFHIAICTNNGRTFMGKIAKHKVDFSYRGVVIENN